MKKIIIIVLLVFSLFGCTKKDIHQTEYQDWYQELQQVSKSDEDLPFELEANIEELVNGEYMYHVIIDNVKESVENIRAMVIHDMKTEDIFPSIGIFDDPVSLLKEDGSSAKGIALVGYFNKTNEEITLKIKVEYVLNKQEYIKYKIISFDKI